MKPDNYPRPANFAQAVRMMREAQKEYFSLHTRSTLAKSIHYERWVDEYLTAHPEPGQAGLFSQPTEPEQTDLFGRQEKKPEDRS